MSDAKKLRESSIEVLVLDEGEKGTLDRQLKRIELDSEQVEQVRDSLERLRVLLPEDDEPRDGTVERWRMDEIKLSLDVSANGSVVLAGIGVKAGIQVTFKRQG
jgi:hypothetical protein